MPKKHRSRRNRSRNVRGARHIFAVIASGKSVTCFADTMHFPTDRPVRITHVTGDATMSKGPCGLVEVVLYNQAETNIATSAVKTCCTANITRLRVSPPQGADMWIDSGRTQSATTKILHIDFPCVSKDFADYRIVVNLMVHYAAGPEQIENVCPTVLLKDDGDDSDILDITKSGTSFQLV